MPWNNDIFKSVLDELYDGVYFTDAERHIVYWNRAAERLTGYSADEVIGHPCWDNILMHVDAQGHSMCRGICPLAKTLVDGNLREAEAFFHHKAGHMVPASIRVAPIRDARGNIVGVAEIFSDNSAIENARQRIEELQKMALFDTVTELGNRRYAEMNLNSRLNELSRYGLSFGLLFIDIDHFKHINDHFGHDKGDKVLQSVARTLRSGVRASDMVGRWGGEEFLVLVANVDAAQLGVVANKLRTLVESMALHLNGVSAQVTVSIGATMARSDDTPQTLVERSDALMYRSKESGRNRVTCDATPVLPAVGSP